MAMKVSRDPDYYTIRLRGMSCEMIQPIVGHYNRFKLLSTQERYDLIAKLAGLDFGTERYLIRYWREFSTVSARYFSKCYYASSVYQQIKKHAKLTDAFVLCILTEIFMRYCYDKFVLKRNDIPG